MENEYKKITGHNTPEEYAAWEEGYDAATKIIIEWIEKWNGSTNSRMGELLMKKCKEINHQDQIDSNGTE